MLAGALRGLMPRRSPADRAAQPSGRWFSRDAAIMGTAIHVELWSDDRATATRAIDAVIDEMHRIDALMSPYKASSELSLVNRDADRRPVAVCPELFDLIERSIEYSVLSGGVFDITYASVGHLYDYRKRIRPSEAQLEAARGAIGYRNLQLDRERTHDPLRTRRRADRPRRLRQGLRGRQRRIDPRAARHPARRRRRRR